jgi:hypothetical protein
MAYEIEIDQQVMLLEPYSRIELLEQLYLQQLNHFFEFWTIAFTSGGWADPFWEVGTIYDSYNGDKVTTVLKFQTDSDYTLVSQPQMVQPLSIYMPIVETAERYVKLRFDQETTNAYAQIYVVYFNATYHQWRLTCSDSGQNNSSQLVFTTAIDEIWMTVQANGDCSILIGDVVKTITGIFTADYKITCTVTQTNVSTKTFWDDYKFNLKTGKNWAYMDSQAQDLYNPNGIQALQFNGQITGPCIGLPQGPAGELIEYIWCGKACGELDSLRNATETGFSGRGGFLLDEDLMKTYHIVTSLIETAYYANCEPDNDEFIQALNPDSPGYYSFHALYSNMESLLGLGRFASQDLDMIYVPANLRAEFDMEGNLGLLAGPKNVIDYGVAGAADYDQEFNSSTTDDWDAEAGSNFIVDADSIDIDTESEEGGFGDEILHDPYDSGLFAHYATGVYGDGSHWRQMDREYFVGIRTTVSGTNVTIWIFVYKFNFTTETITSVSNFNCYTEPEDTYACANNRLAWAPTHGSEGKLYVGDPLYSAAKSEQGRIRVYTWSSSTETFTFSEDITEGIRVRRLGACIGWDDDTDLLLSSEFDDDIIAFDASDSYSSPWTYTGSGEMGLCFSVGGGLILAVGSASGDYIERVSITTTAATFVSHGVTSYTNAGPWNVEPVYPNGRSGGREPRVTTMQSTVHITYYIGGYASVKMHPALMWNEDRLVQWYTNSPATTDYLYENTTFPNAGCATVGTELDTNAAGSYWLSDFIHNMVFWDGSSDDEYLVSLGHYLPAGTSSWRYYVTKLGPVILEHVTIGKYYVEYLHSLVGVESIATASIVMTADNATYGVYSSWFFKLGTTFWVATSATTFQSYGTAALAKAAAASITLFSTAVPNIDYSGYTEITFYFCMEKEENWTYPLETVSLESITLGQVPPGLDEPILCLHFESGERCKEFFKTTDDELIAVTDTPANAAGLNVMVSGTFMRPLYTV